MAQESRLVIVIDSQNAVRNARNLSNELDSIERKGEFASKSTDRLSVATRQLAGYMAGLVTVSEAISKMDTYTGLQNRLKLVTKNQTELNKATEDTFIIAQKTYSAWDSVLQVYQRFSDNAKTLNLTMDDTARLTETVSKAVAISGASAQAADAALVQFGQALASGTLRGEELNSVMEQTPALAKAIAQGMGITVGELRTVAAQGKITSQEIVKALKNVQNDVDALFAKTDITIGQSLTLLNNQITKFVGEAGKGSGAAQTLAGGIQLLGNNLNVIIDGAIIVGIGLITKAILTKTVAVQASIVASAQQRAANFAEAQSQVQLLGIEAMRARQSAALAITEIGLARAEYNAALSANARAAAIQRLTAAEIAHNIAVKEATVATTAYSVAQSRLTTVATLGSRALGLVGGPIGAITLGITALAAGYMYFQDKAAKATQKLEEQAKVAERTDEALKKLSGNDKAKAVNDLTTAFKAQNEALEKSSFAVGAALIDIENYARGNKEVEKISQDARNGTISYSEAIERLNKIKLPTDLYENLKTQAAQYDENSSKASLSAEKLKIFGVEVSLAGNKAQNAAVQVKSNTDELHGNANAAERAAKAQKGYFESLRSEVLKSNEELALLNLGYSEETVKKIIELQKVKQAVAPPGTTAIVTKEEMDLVAQAQKALDVLKDKKDELTAAERKHTSELEKQQKVLSINAKVQANAAKYNFSSIESKYNLPAGDGTFKEAYCNNPAWIYYDICTADRYALGDRLTPLMVDKWSLYRLAQYCDQMVPDGLGGQEPRFTCNVYLQSAEGAFEILTKLAGVFRAITFWDGMSIICDADIPQDTYFTYTRANVIDGNFEYAGTRARDRHNVVKVAWDNPANHYKTEYEFVRDEKAIAEAGQVRILEIDAWGCTSRGQAQRAGWWALKSEQLETRTVSFKVGLDGYIPLPGKVIEIADPLFAGRANGGRVSKISADRKSITLDRDDVVAVAGDRLIINGEDGKAQARIVQSISGRVVTVTHEFDAIATQNVWVIDAQDLATMKFRVISITQDESHQFSVTALQYNPAKFDAIDKGAYFDEVPISIVNPTIQDPVSDVVITSESRIDQGINVATMIVSWSQAKGAVKYQVEWRKDDGSWIKLPITGNNSVEVPGIYAGQYQARVTAISAFEIASFPVYSVLTELTGKQGLPPKLASIQATGILFGIRLDWSFPTTGALDTAHTEIQVSPDGKSNIAQLGLFAYPTSTHTIQGLQPNLTQFYRGRLIDRIGNIGPWSDWTSATTSADASEILEMLEGKISETELSKDLQTKIDHIENIDAQIPGIIQDIKNTKDQIAQEVKDRQSSVQQSIDQANDNLNLEREARIKDIDSANQLIAQEVQNRINADISEQKAREAAILEEAKSRETAITSEKEERISGDEHLSQRIETVSASSSDNAAAIQREEKARTDADSALSQRIDTVVAHAGDNTAAIQQEAIARAEGDSANAELIETVRAESVENDIQTRALVTDESKARIEGDRALAERVTGVEVVTKPALIGSESDLIGNDAGYAGVWSILSAVQEGDLLQAKRTDQVIVSVNDNAASINSEQIARIEGDKVVTKALTDYRASNDLALANVRQTAESAVSNSESNAKALTELDSRVNTVDANANEARQNAASAISKAETAVSEAGSAASIAQQAHAEASTATTTANNATDNANEAKQTSATALSQANVAAGQSAANAEQIQSIQVDLKDKATTGDITQVKSDIKDVDNKINAQTTRIDGVYAQINPPLIGSDSDLIGNDGGYAGVWSEQSARIESDLVVSKRVDSTNAVLGDLQAYTQQEVQSRIEGDKITVQKIDNYIASNDSALAIVRDTAKIGVDQSSANIEAIKNINIELKDKATTGDITQVKSDINEVDKKVTAQTIRLDGVYAQINPPLIGSDSDLIGNDGGYAGVWSEQSARIESDLAQAIRTDTVQTDLNGNKAAVQEVTKSVNGLYTQKFIKLDVNGKIAGWGGANDGVESQFIFNFDSIAIGNGSNGAISYPFIFRTTSFTDPLTGTVFPPAAYLKAAIMDYQSVDTSHIKDLAVQRGKIAELAVGSGQIDNLAVTRGKIADLAVDTLKIADNAVTVPVSAFAEFSVGVDTEYVTIQTLNVPSDMGHTVLTFGAVFSFTGYSQKQQVYCRVLKNDQVVFEDLEVHFIEHTSVASITDANGSHNHNGSTVSVSGNTGQDGSHSHGFGVSGTTGSTNAGGTFHSHSFSSNGNTNNSGSHSHSVSLGGNITMSEGGEHKHNISVTGSSRSAGTLNISRHDSTGIYGTYKLQLRVVAGGSMNVSQRYIHAMTMRK